MKTWQISSLDTELENKATTVLDLTAELNSMKLSEAGVLFRTSFRFRKLVCNFGLNKTAKHNHKLILDNDTNIKNFKHEKPEF